MTNISSRKSSGGAVLLKVEHLKGGYGQHLALWDVSIEVSEAQCIAVIGANGAGKSTLLRTISGVLRPEQGKVNFRGIDITGLLPHDIATLGISHVPEGRGIFPDLTVSENLALGLPGAGRAAAKKLVERAAEMFPPIGLLSKRLGGSLSGGEQQMVAIARGLLSDPAIVLLDEPTLGLAPVMVDQMIEALLKIRHRGTSFVVVEQNVEAALELADWGYVLASGKCHMSAAANDLRGDAAVVGAYVGFAASEVK